MMCLLIYLLYRSSKITQLYSKIHLCSRYGPVSFNLTIIFLISTKKHPIVYDYLYKLAIYTGGIQNHSIKHSACSQSIIVTFSTKTVLFGTFGILRNTILKP